MYLMATATYTDGFGSDSAYMVSSAAVSQLAVNGEPEVEHPENVTNVATYTASGAASVQWSLSGDDARDFNINGGQLTFRTSPDYEDPADANTDNVYMVTVVATAGTLMDTQDVTVTVSNVNEAGTVTLSTMSPAVGSEVTASLTDLTWRHNRDHLAVVVHDHGRNRYRHRHGNLGQLYPRRGRRGHVPAGHGYLHRRPRHWQDGHQRGRHGQRRHSRHSGWV